MPKFTVTYFNSPGRAEPVRIALFIAGLPFEDRRLDFPQFAAMRAEGRFPLGSVPTLEVDGFAMAQTASMLRYIARLGGTTLYPTDPMAAFIVDSAIDTVNDTLSHALMPSLFERDMAKKLEMRQTFAAGPMASAFKYIESLLERSGGPFLAGPELSIGDLVVGNQFVAMQKGVLDGITPAMLDAYPRMKRLASAYIEHPQIVAFYKR